MVYYFSKSSVKFQGHAGQKIIDFVPNERFRAVTSAWIHWRSHETKKSPILTRIECFRTATPVWIHWWLWKDAQIWTEYRRCTLLFSKVIHQISRSHGTKNCRFWPGLCVSGLYLLFEFTNGFERMHIAWHNEEDMLYCSSRSSIKFLCHTGWKIDDFNPIWVRSLGRSQLSNPSDLPCFFHISYKWTTWFKGGLLQTVSTNFHSL